MPGEEGRAGSASQALGNQERAAAITQVLRASRVPSRSSTLGDAPWGLETHRAMPCSILPIKARPFISMLTSHQMWAVSR